MAENISYVFNVFLKREMAFESDEIAGRVEKRLEEHFSFHSRPAALTAAQINRLTGIAYSSDDTKNLQRFVEHQVEKEGRGAGRKPWTAGNLDKFLLGQIKEIREKKSKQVYEEALKNSKESMRAVEEVEKFDKANRKRLILEISIELLKRFADHFGIHYLYRGRKNV